MSDMPPAIVPSPPLEPEHNYDSWIGRNTYTADDPEPVGEIGEIYYDVGTQRPEWLVLATRNLVPIAGTTLGGLYNDLILGFTRDRITQAPTVEPDAALTLQDEQDLYTYYGFDWTDPVPDPLPARFDDGWDTGWTSARPTDTPRTGDESRMFPFTPVITPPPPPPDPDALPDTVTVTVNGSQVRLDVAGAQPNVKYSIDWGDGRSASTGQTNTAGNAFEQHNYNTAGTWTIVVTNRADGSLIGTVTVTTPSV